MFSSEKRCHYRNSPLAEVICQLRFPQILSINTNTPADFQEKIRGQFPKYNANVEKVTHNAPGQVQASLVNYQFSSQDGLWRVNLTSSSIALSTHRYNGWEDFAERLDGPLAAFIQIYKPAYFERVGLRYVNFFSRQKLGLEGTPFRDMFAPEYLGLMGNETLPENTFNRNTVDVDFDIGNNCRVQLHAGPGLININGQQSKEVHFVFDCDYYVSGNIPVNYSAGTLQTLHAKTYPLFRGAITELLHDAMEPVEL